MATESEQVEVVWAEEVEDFVRNMTKGLNPMLTAEKPILVPAIEVARSLFDRLEISDEDFGICVQGFCLGALMTQIASNDALRFKPEYVKDMALHFGAAFGVAVAANSNRDITVEEDS